MGFYDIISIDSLYVMIKIKCECSNVSECKFLKMIWKKKK